MGVSHGWDKAVFKPATSVVVCKATYQIVIGPWPSLADHLGALAGVEGGTGGMPADLTFHALFTQGIQGIVQRYIGP